MSERTYPFSLTRDEVGLCIDGVAKLVSPYDQTAAPLLHRLQSLYAKTKDLEPLLASPPEGKP